MRHGIIMPTHTRPECQESFSRMLQAEIMRSCHDLSFPFTHRVQPVGFPIGVTQERLTGYLLTPSVTILSES